KFITNSDELVVVEGQDLQSMGSRQVVPPAKVLSMLEGVIGPPQEVLGQGRGLRIHASLQFYFDARRVDGSLELLVARASPSPRIPEAPPSQIVHRQPPLLTCYLSRSFSNSTRLRA